MPAQATPLDRAIEEIANALGHANINNTYGAYMGVRDEDADFAREAAFAAAPGGKE